jgi:OHCU decarboxylase
MKPSIAEINAMSAGDFAAAFGGVAEHSPWVARHAASARPFASRAVMIQAFTNAVQGASREAQLALLRAHPDLGTRAGLTEDSSREQAGAGLDGLPSNELSRFDHLNRHYKSKFDFPFILAVKGATRQQILDGFSGRVNNSADDEFAIALGEVCRIFRFRIEDRVEP